MNLQKVELVTYLIITIGGGGIIEVEKEQGAFKKSKCYVRQQEEPMMRKLSYSFSKLLILLTQLELTSIRHFSIRANFRWHF